MTTAEKTCTKCGATKPVELFAVERRRKDGRYPHCKECTAAYRAVRYQKQKARILAQMAEYRAANPDVIRERKAKYYAENREAVGARTAERYAKNPEKKLEYQKAYQEENPHVMWAAGYRKRTKRKGLEPGIVEDFTRADVVATYGDSCFYCPEGAFEHLDHYVPVDSGGHHTLANVRPSCGFCNDSKRNHDAEEWLATRSASGSPVVTDVDRAALADLYEGSK